MKMAQQHVVKMRIDAAIFRVLSNVISDDDFTVDGLLKQEMPIQEKEIVQDLLFEFYYHFNICAKRATTIKKCAGRSSCMSLKIHAILILLELKSKNETEKAEQLQHSIAELLHESTDIRRPNTRPYHSCHGVHYPLDVVMAYHDAKRCLEHPIFTNLLCRRIIQTLVDKLDDYLHICITRERTAWIHTCENGCCTPQPPFGNMTGSVKLLLPTGEHHMVVPLFGKIPVISNVLDEMKPSETTVNRLPNNAGTIRQREEEEEDNKENNQQFVLESSPDPSNPEDD